MNNLSTAYVQTGHGKDYISFMSSFVNTMIKVNRRIYIPNHLDKF